MKVLVSIPTTGWVHKRAASAAMSLLVDRRGYQVTVIQPTHRPFENNLHHIVRHMLRDQYAYWVSFDADNPPTRNPLELIDYDLDIVGCPTPVWHYEGKPRERPIYWNAYQKKSQTEGYIEWPDKAGLQRVDAIGTGCFVTARRVWEHPNMQQGPFTRALNADGTVERGNDLVFCERAQQAGFDVWAHFDYSCLHFKELELGEVAQAFRGLLCPTS